MEAAPLNALVALTSGLFDMAMVASLPVPGVLAGNASVRCCTVIAPRVIAQGRLRRPIIND